MTQNEQNRAISCLRLAIDLSGDGGMSQFTDKEEELMNNFLDMHSEKIVKLNDVIQFLEEHYLDDKYWTSDGEDLFMHILLDDLKKKMEE